MPSSAVVEAFFDPATFTVSYLVVDPATRRAAIVDPVLDYDFRGGRVSTASADRIAARVREQGLEVEWLLETHVHADHLSAAAYLKGRVGGRIGIGARVLETQRFFGPMFNPGGGFRADGSQFDHLFEDEEAFAVGRLAARVLMVPGHTPADVAYVIDGAAFVGDTLFMPDVGTARADFPGGDARQLYRSLRRLLALPAETPIYVCHDYPPAGREPQWVSSVAEQRAANIHVHDGIGEDAFVELRHRRDATLDAPTLLLPSIQVNIRGGRLPEPEADGRRYLRIPLAPTPAP